MNSIVLLKDLLMVRTALIAKLVLALDAYMNNKNTGQFKIPAYIEAFLSCAVDVMAVVPDVAAAPAELVAAFDTCCTLCLANSRRFLSL